MFVIGASANVGETGLFIKESDAITIDTVSDITVNRITEDGNIDAENSPTDQTQSNIISLGDVDITANTDNISVNYISSQGNITLTAISGSILETSDDTTDDIKATGLITLTATGDISAPDTYDDMYLDFADQSAVVAFSTEKGNIHLRGEGTLFLNDIDTTNGKIDSIANDQIQAKDIVSGGENISIHNLSGDILIGSMTSAGQVVIISDQGSIIDSTEDNQSDITAGTNEIFLTAANHITGTNNTSLELANNSIVKAHTTTEGTIHLTGTGALTLKNVSATGSIEINAANDIIAENVVNSDIGDNALHDIAITSTSGSIEAFVISSINNVNLNAGQAIINKAGLITANDATLKAVTGIGTSTDFINLDINRLDAANQSTNGIYVNNTKALTLSDLDNDSRAIVNQSDADII
ncbi:MAG: hypothetical protein OMM_13144, partial [Candidatus Magnetoglobus multicellularis str. Araruama]